MRHERDNHIEWLIEQDRMARKFAKMAIIGFVALALLLAVLA